MSTSIALDDRNGRLFLALAKARCRLCRGHQSICANGDHGECICPYCGECISYLDGCWWRRVR